MAVVGAGWAGRRQAEAAHELGGEIDIVALMDSDRDHVVKTATELGIERTSTDFDAILADTEIGAVSICTPHLLHESMTLAALSAGKHVLVEKPMASSVAEATRMVEAAKAAGRVLYVAENEVHTQRMVELRRIVSTREHIGELAFAACIAGYRQPSPAYPGRRAWLTDPAAGGTGTWMLQGIHTVAQLRFVLGEVASVYVLDHRTSSFERPDLEATMSGIVELESGVVVWLVQTTETHLTPLLTGFRLYGDEGAVIGDDEAYHVYRGDLREGRHPTTLRYPAQDLSSYALELRAFADAVAGHGAGPTTGASECRSLAIIEAGLESARSRQPVDLKLRYPGMWVDSDPRPALT